MNTSDYKEQYCLCGNTLVTEHELDRGECSECEESYSQHDNPNLPLNFEDD